MRWLKKKIDGGEYIKGYWKEYQIFSSEFSIVCRQLAFAEGGIFWIFFQLNACKCIIVLGLFFLILYFVFDALQYYAGMSKYFELAEEMQAKYKVDENVLFFEDVKKPENFDKPIRLFCNIKGCFIVLASIVLLVVFIKLFLLVTDLHLINI